MDFLLISPTDLLLSLTVVGGLAGGLSLLFATVPCVVLRISHLLGGCGKIEESNDRGGRTTVVVVASSSSSQQQQANYNDITRSCCDERDNISIKIITNKS